MSEQPSEQTGEQTGEQAEKRVLTIVGQFNGQAHWDTFVDGMVHAVENAGLGCTISAFRGPVADRMETIINETAAE